MYHIHIHSCIHFHHAGAFHDSHHRCSSLYIIFMFMQLYLVFIFITYTAGTFHHLHRRCSSLSSSVLLSLTIPLHTDDAVHLCVSHPRRHVSSAICHPVPFILPHPIHLILHCRRISHPTPQAQLSYLMLKAPRYRHNSTILFQSLCLVQSLSHSNPTPQVHFTSRTTGGILLSHAKVPAPQAYSAILFLSSCHLTCPFCLPILCRRHRSPMSRQRPCTAGAICHPVPFLTHLSHPKHL
jgi:hypothetical protein